MNICRHDEGNRTRLRQNHYKRVVEIIGNKKKETADLLADSFDSVGVRCICRSSLESKTADLIVDGFKAVGARGFEPPTSCTPCKRASRAAPRPDWQGVL